MKPSLFLLFEAKFTFCEFLNLGNAVGQFYLTDKFLGGEFMEYGIKAVDFLMTDDKDKCDPMHQVG